VDQLAYDPPSEIGSQWTPNTATQINDMFRLLFKSMTRTEAQPGASSVVSQDLQVKTVKITAAQVKTLNGTSVTLVEAPDPNQIIIPVMSWSHCNVSTSFAQTVTIDLEWGGFLNSNIDGPSLVTSGTGRRTDIVAAGLAISSNNPLGAALIIHATTANPAVGALSPDICYISVVYYTQTLD